MEDALFRTTFRSSFQDRFSSSSGPGAVASEQEAKGGEAGATPFGVLCSPCGGFDGGGVIGGGIDDDGVGGGGFDGDGVGVGRFSFGLYIVGSASNE